MLGRLPRCHQAPQHWQCTHARGHDGPCRMRLSGIGRVRYALHRLRVWPGRMIRKLARRLTSSHTRCPSCGRRETPHVIEPCRHCGFFSPF